VGPPSGARETLSPWPAEAGPRGTHRTAFVPGIETGCLTPRAPLVAPAVSISSR
jgi:hypothetical protein